ncbi:hypothetical protein BDV35DRAFT_345586 [Aspergillus flavus]|uniref:Uncharacterized protein n=1 Tax=Aspergillus flavus TaxID=5059 RepID=A0A5N6H4S5_ASPFL|nr:hypothetical protein BDV35DRAFT_345586 [Aspergillus flavus]
MGGVNLKSSWVDLYIIQTSLEARKSLTFWAKQPELAGDHKSGNEKSLHCALGDVAESCYARFTNQSSLRSGTFILPQIRRGGVVQVKKYTMVDT